MELHRSHSYFPSDAQAPSDAVYLTNLTFKKVGDVEAWIGRFVPRLVPFPSRASENVTCGSAMGSAAVERMLSIH